MSHRGKLVVAIGLILLAGTVAAVLVLTKSDQPGRPVDSIVTSPSPASLVSSEEEARVNGYAREFASLYYNYTRPDNPAYLNSFRPFVSDSLYMRLVSDNRKASRFPIIPSLTSTVRSLKTRVVDRTTLSITVTVESTPSGGTARTEELLTKWQKLDNRWQLVDLTTEPRG